jgi:pimeloyl-ACP methyl ester carboxylesterase
MHNPLTEAEQRPPGYDPAMPLAKVNGLEIYYDDFGDPADPALILIAGLGAQLLNYPDELCLAFVDRGLRVVRFDNRDAGLSTHLPEGTSYGLDDMAADAIGLLDHLGIDDAHVWGSSLGGMIAQTMAIGHPDRVRSVISVQSTTGEAEVGQPDPDAVVRIIATTEPSTSREEAIAKSVQMYEVLLNNPAITDVELLTIRAAANYDRAYDPAGSTRQIGAVMTAPSRVDGLAALAMPVLVIHGNRDPLIGISGGVRTAELVPRSTFIEIDGMGHDLTPVFWSQYVDAVVAHIAAIETAG